MKLNCGCLVLPWSGLPLMVSVWEAMPAGGGRAAMDEDFSPCREVDLGHISIASCQPSNTCSGGVCFVVTGLHWRVEYETTC